MAKVTYEKEFYHVAACFEEHKRCQCGISSFLWAWDLSCSWRETRICVFLVEMKRRRFPFHKTPRVFPFGWFTFLTCHSNRNKSGWNFFLEKFKTNLPSSSKRIYFKIFRLKKGNFLIKILGQNKCIQCLTHFVIIVWKTNKKAGKILVTSSAE